jgi:hypothetical protein
MPIDDSEKHRRRALLDAHFKAENDHDLGRIMATFGSETEMIYNRQRFGDHSSIAMAHSYMGFAGRGAFTGLQMMRDSEHCTDDEIVVEGRMIGKHTGKFQGFAPTGREMELPFVAFYRFDKAGKLVSERVVMNLGTLANIPARRGPE